ncbi:MAG: hypothetical protein ACREHF_10735 [Rhizomicrobium sp.]
MRVRAAILKPKRVTSKGAWKLVTGTSKMPKNAFPIGSNYPVTFGRNWRWRVDKLAADDGTFYRLFIAFNYGIQEFAAWLAEDSERSLALLARYEFHGTHPGWHCHAPCADLFSGRCRCVPHTRLFSPSWRERIPSPSRI